MNKKAKIVASATATIAMCSSLVVGGTFALFTSESKVNVAINSGKVDVVANVNNLQAYSGSWNSETFSYDSVVSTREYSEADSNGYYFANGGFASLSTTENTVTLNRITPMDKVTFDIVIHNDSNVTVQYRTVIKVTDDDGLFSGLEVKIGAEEQVYGGTTTYSHWTTLNAGSDDITVPVSIELPQEVGNEYQDKQCTISYSVDAVQGNAYVFDGEAWLIDAEGNTREMDTLSYALTRAQAGDTIKMAHAGTYDPFTVTTEGVTVEGIIGDTKADSTVFVTTATENVKLAASDVTLKNIWVEVGAEQIGISGWTKRGALNADVSGADNFTLDGCYFNGNNLVDRAFLFCKSKLTVNNCTFENFNYCAFDSMDDNSTPELITITNNTFKGLNVAYDIYAGKGYTGTEKNLVIKNNVSDNGAIVRIWDYAQYVRPTEGSAFNAEVMGNENISLYLAHFDNHYVTPIETDVTDIVYQMEVALPGVASGSYKVTNADGSEITTFGDHKTTRVRNGNVLVYALRAGDYMLKNDDHTYLFTVVDHTAGVLGSGYTAVNVREPLADGFCYNLSAGVYEVSSAAGLTAFEKSVNDNGNTYAGKTVKLMDDVDLAGIEWKPVGQTGGYSAATYFQGTFDGNGKTISNLTIGESSWEAGSNEGQNFATGFFGFIDMGSATIKNVTFDNANVEGHHWVGVVAGYMTGTVSDVTVTNSTVTSSYKTSEADGDKAGGIVGYLNEGSITGCTVSGSTITAVRDNGSVVGYSTASGSVTGNTAENCTVYYSTDNSAQIGGEIAGKRAEGVSNNTATNVTVTKLVSVATAEQLSAALNATYSADTTIVLTDDIDLAGVEWGAHILKGSNNSALTIDGNGKTIYGLTSSNYNNGNGFNSNGLVTCIMSSLYSVTFKNLTVSGANLSNNGGWNAATGVFVGDINTVKVTFDTCTVTGATVTSDAYAAGFVGYVQDVYVADPDLSCPLILKNCSVTNSIFNGSDATGALVGLNNGSTIINDTTVTGNTINGGAGYSAAALVGTSVPGTTATNVTVSGNTYSITDTRYQVSDATYGYIYHNDQTYTVNGTALN